ncbi:MAG: restriction endonuclease subunit S [Bacillota bacterium]|nr:restriction endonuclease subunit S [Bacillota bacterium]
MDWLVDCFDTIYFENSRNGLTRPKSVRGEGYKMINMGELYRYDRLWNPEMELVPLSTSEIEKYSLKNGDLLFARQSLVLEGTGKCSIVMSAPEITCFESHLIRVRLDKQIADPLFYYYYFSSPQGKDNVQSLVMQVAAAGIRGSELAKLKIPVPSLLTQRKIAAILSAYDDLIETNLRRIKILEEMAQNLYREWFVNFRFPGHGQTRFVDYPPGQIPEGWEFSTLGEQLIALESGKRPKGGIKDINCGIPSIGAENIDGIGRHNYQKEKYVPVDFFNSMKTGKVKDRDVGLYKDGAYIGKSTYFRDGFPHDILCINEHVFLLRSNNRTMTQNQLYLWLQESSTVSGIRATNANAAQPGINQNSIRGLQITIAPEKVVLDFDNLVNPLLAQVINLAKRNLTLSQTRDLLLSRLISGEVNVSGLDIKVPEEVAI